MEGSLSNRSFVYWIHLPAHTNMLVEGYIGVTSKSVDERFKKHIKDATSKNWRTYTLHNAIRKYGVDALVVDTVLIGEEAYCYDVEAKLRPAKSIGWNTAEGGFSPPKGTGKECKKETREKIGQANRRNAMEWTEAQRQERSLRAKMHAEKIPPWYKHNTCLEMWLYARDFALAIERGAGAKGVAKCFPYGNISSLQVLFRKIKGGWNPDADTGWLEFFESERSRYNLQIGENICAVLSPTRNRLSAIRKELVKIEGFTFKAWVYNKKSNADVVAKYVIPLYQATDAGTNLDAALLFNKELPVFSNPSFYRWLARFRGGWNPSEDPEYLKWREEQLTLQERN